MKGRVVTLILSACGAALAISPPDAPRALAMAQQRAAESGPARLWAAALRADPGLAAAQPAPAEGDAPAPPDAQEAIAGFGARAPTLQACAELGELVEAWNTWAERHWLWQYAIVGLPGEARAQDARVAAAAVLSLSATDATALDGAIEQADRDLALRRDDALEQQITEALQAKEVVLPLRSARAAIALASLTSEADAQGSLARMVQEVCRRVPSVSAWAETERALLLGHAGALLGESAEAAKLFDSVLRGGVTDGLPKEFIAGAKLEALLAGSVAKARAVGAIGAQRELDTQLARDPGRSWIASSVNRALLAADTSMRLARLQVAQGGEQTQRSQALALALARYADALRTSDAAVSREGVAALVLEHLAPLIPVRESYRDLHPIAAIARARALASAPETRSQAIVILDEAMARPSADLGSLAAQVMFDLAATCAQADDASTLKRSVELLLAFSDRFASDERAGAALALACAASDRLLRLAPNDADPGPPAAERIEIAIDALRRAHTSAADVPERDAWRLALARLLIWRVESGLVTSPEAVASAREVAAALSSVREQPLVVQAAVERAAAWNAALALPGTAPDVAKELSMRMLAAVEDARSEIALVGETDTETQARLITFYCRGALAEERAAEVLERISPLLGDAAASLGARVQAEALAIALEAQIRLATPMGSALQTALKLESIRPNAARSLIERQAGAVWREIQPSTWGLVTVSSPDARLGPPQMLVLTLASRLAGDVESGPDGEASARRVAWALLLYGRANEAIELFERLSRARPDVLEYRRGVGEALLFKGEDQEAFAQFRQIVAAADADESPEVWFAWTRMLEILARHNQDGARTAEIRREIARLRTLDSAPDRPECLDRLRSIEDALPAR